MMLTRAQVLAKAERARKWRDRRINAIILGCLLLPVIAAAGTIYIALHFLIKFW